MNRHIRFTAFSGAVCIVTGAASGMGHAISSLLCSSGATVVVADIDGEAVALAADQLRSAGGNCQAIRLDVADHDAVDAAVANTVQCHGRLDYMFNNAGVNYMGDVRDINLDTWRKIINVNLWGVIHGTRAAYDVMVSQGSGHIVNMASGLGITPGPRNVAYSASKFAVVGLSESIRIEAADLGIHVTVVCPGWIKTPMLDTGNVVTPDGSPVNPLSLEKAASKLPFALMSADKAADCVLRGVVRKRSMIVFPRYVHFFWWLYRFCRPFSDFCNLREIRVFREMTKDYVDRSRQAPPIRAAQTARGHEV